MDWLTFTAELTKALAWPLMALALLIVLRRPIQRLLPLVGRVKFKDFEMDFGRRLEAAAAETAALEKEQGVENRGLAAADDLLQLAEVSPRAAILEAWIRLEAAAMQAARCKDVTITGSQLRLPHQLVVTLKEQGVIDARQAAIFDDLRGLRNSAAHATRFRPNSESAREYVRLAGRLERSLSCSEAPMAAA